MSKRVKGPDGITRIFPDDATDEEIGAALEVSVPRVGEPKIGAAHPSRMSASAPHSALPDTADGRYQANWGEKPLLPESARAAMSEPLARPTGVDAIDSLTSPTSLLLMAGEAGAPLVKGAARLLGRAKMPTPDQLRRIGEIVGSPMKEGSKAALGKLADIIEKRAAPAAEAAEKAAPVLEKAAALSPAKALDVARDAFKAAGVEPLRGEVSNAHALLMRGKSPDEALKIVLGNRPTSALSPIEKLAKMPGVMTDAERRAAQDLRWASGSVKTPSAETARAGR